MTEQEGASASRRPSPAIQPGLPSMIERYTITSREEWLRWRRQDVTASDVGCLFDANPYKSQFELYAEKRGLLGGTRETPIMRRGRLFQSAAIAALRDKYPDAEELSVYLRDPDVRIGATPDGVAGTLAIETKVVAKPVFEAWEEDPPLGYQLQTATVAMLMGADAALLAVLAVDAYEADLHVFHMKRLQAAEERIIESVRQFWRNIEDDVEPPPDYRKDGEAIARMFRPREQVDALDLSGDNRLPEILTERVGLLAAVKASEERLDAIKAEIIHKLGGAPAAICGDWKISNKTQVRREVVLPQVSFPVLRVSRKKAAQ